MIKIKIYWPFLRAAQLLIALLNLFMIGKRRVYYAVHRTDCKIYLVLGLWDGYFTIWSSPLHRNEKQAGYNSWQVLQPRMFSVPRIRPYGLNTHVFESAWLGRSMSLPMSSANIKPN